MYLVFQGFINYYFPIYIELMMDNFNHQNINHSMLLIISLFMRAKFTKIYLVT